MIPLRTFPNLIEANLAKARLDEYGILCALADENVNLYGGGPMAMPVRLLVTPDKLEEAERVLTSTGPELPEDVDISPATTTPAEPTALSPEDTQRQLLRGIESIQRNNRWIVLVLIGLLGMTIYLLGELPRATSSPWDPVREAMHQYDYEKALRLAHAISDAHPDDSYGHEFLGSIYAARGDLARAEAEYGKAVELSPPHLLQLKLERVRQRRASEGSPSSPGPTSSPQS